MTLRERGAAVLLSLAVSACVAGPPAPTASPAPSSPAPLARAAATILTEVSAYDYALAGSFAGERIRVVTPERYGAALAPDRAAIAALKDQIVGAAFADRDAAGALVKLADALVAVAIDVGGVADARDEATFARTLADVDGAWSLLHDVAAPIGDPALDAALSRGASWRVAATPRDGFAVLTQPYGSRDEAQRVATQVGAVESVSSVSPFTVRVITTDDRASAERRVADLRANGIVAAAVAVRRYSFARSGPDPAAELWREPAVDIPTWTGARRAAFVAGGVVVASADGNVFSFYPDGRLWWHVSVAVGPTFATPSADGRSLVVGGQFVSVVTSAGRIFDPPARLPSAAAGAVWVDRRAVFVAASQGPTGRAEGGPGGVVALGADGKALGKPFPLVTPAAGPALAANRVRDDVLIATTSSGTTDVETIRPGADDKVRPLVRVAGQVVDLAVDGEGAYAALVTAQGTYRFAPSAADVAATLERVGTVARDLAFGADGTLYLVFPERLVAYDRGLRARWTVPVSDGRRVVVGRRVVLQDGLSRVLAVDPATGAADELAAVGDLSDVAVSADGSRVLLLADGKRAAIFQLP